MRNLTIEKKIKEQFYIRTGYNLNLDNPTSFNEKIQWLKLHYKDPLLTKCADKYAVRDYIKEKIGDKYLIPLLGVYDTPEQIDFKKLPNKFVLKVNNGSGKNIICKNKNKLDIKETNKKLIEWLKPENNHFFSSYEWAYKNIKPKIVCEQYLKTNHNNQIDYKFMCFHGKVKYIFTCSERFTDLKVNFYNLKWDLLPFIRLYPNSKRKISKPKKLDEMIKIAKILSKDFPFVRVDLYLNYDNIYFGELTFYPGNGMEKFEPIEYDYKIGKLLTLPKPKNLLRIAYLTPEYVTEEYFSGGLANYLHRTVLTLKSLHHDPEIFLASNQDNDFISEGILIHRVDCSKTNDRTYNIYNHEWSNSSKCLNDRLLEIHNKNPFDIVQYASWTATGLYRVKDIPAVTRISSFRPIYANSDKENFENINISTLEDKIELHSLEKSDNIICPSNFIADKISKFIHNNIFIIESPFIVDIKKLDYSVYNEILKNKKYLLFFGRLTANKGIEEITQIIYKILKKYPELFFVFIGNGDINPVLNNANNYKNRIIYITALRHPQLYPIIKNSFAVVLPSRVDNFPNSCLEAMAHKKIVIGTNGASFEQIIIDGMNGFLAERINSKSLYKKIKQLMKLTSKQKAEIERQALKTIKRLRPEITISKLISCYLSTIQKHYEHADTLEAYSQEINSLVTKYTEVSSQLDNLTNIKNTLYDKLNNINKRKFVKTENNYLKTKNTIFHIINHILKINNEKFNSLTNELISKEIMYGGIVTNVPRNIVSSKDPRSTEQIKNGGMTGEDRMLRHGYAKYYAKYLLPFLKKPIINFVEIGILKGTGLAIWSDIFPSAKIIGLDIDLNHYKKNIFNLKKLKAFKKNKPTVYNFDQFKSNKKFLKKLYSKSKINVCIDDGYHSNETAINTFKQIRPFLSNDFIYFIEDNKTIYPEIRKKYPQYTMYNYGELTIIKNRSFIKKVIKKFINKLCLKK